MTAPAAGATAADAAAIAAGTPPAGAPAPTPPAGTPPAGTPPAGTPAPVAGAPGTPPAPKAGEQPNGAPAIPDKYDLKLPDNISLDPTVVERTDATARALGLSQDNAQKMLGFVAQEVAAQSAAQVEALVKAHQPGGAEWKATETKWREQSLADPFLGGGNPGVFAANQQLADKVAARYGDEELVTLLKDDPMGSHPAVLRFLVRLGKASKESDLVKPTSTTPVAEPTREEQAKKWFPASPDLHTAPATT